VLDFWLARAGGPRGSGLPAAAPGGAGGTAAGDLLNSPTITSPGNDARALAAFAVFIGQRGAARAYDRLLRELDDIERQSPVDRFMASHEQWKERQGD
jgi:hypothetical protein